MAIYVREAGFGATPCVTRARSALSFGFAMTTQTIRFYHQGSIREVADVPASRTVLQHLREHLEANDYFGLDPKLVVRFQQYRMPRLAPDGGPFREDGEVSYAAPGHGDFPMAFRESGCAAAFAARGGRYLTFSNVDNLGASVDLAIVGSHIRSGAQMTVEVAPKNPGDQGGAPAVVDGRLQLVEGFAFPPGFDQDSIDVFNTANYVFTADALAGDVALPWYVVEKKVDGQPVIQFEHLAGDLSTVLTSHFVRIEREERFLPVKNVSDVPGVQEILARTWTAKIAGVLPRA